MKSRWPWLLGFSVVAMLAELSLGATRIAPGAVWLGLSNGASEASPIIRQLRLPRVLLGFLVGGGLAVSGAVLQALVRNPLADPFVLGISGGATLGAVAAISLGLQSPWAVPFAAFAGAPVSVLTKPRSLADQLLRHEPSVDRVLWVDRNPRGGRGAHDGPVCRIEIDERWRPALAGLEGREFVQVLYFMHLARRDLLIQAPKGREGMLGTFALRSPEYFPTLGGTIESLRVRSCEISVQLFPPSVVCQMVLAPKYSLRGLVGAKRIGAVRSIR